MFSSTLNSNLLLNLATLYTLNGSSTNAFVVALIILFSISLIPLNGSTIFPVNTSFAIEFIVISLLAKSSSNFTFSPVIVSNPL